MKNSSARWSLGVSLLVFLLAVPTLPAAEAFDVADLEVAPAPVSMNRPEFPSGLRARGVVGNAVIAFVVDEEGRVRDARIERATESAFGSSALVAVQNWRFRPGIREGKAVSTRMSVPVDFDLGPNQGPLTLEQRLSLEGLPLEGDKVDIARVLVQPTVVYQAVPEYPYAMRRSGLSGEVLVDFVVDTKGNVRNAFAERSTNPWFERVAVAAVAKWRFKPGLVEGGRPVNTHMQVPIIFSLNENERAVWKINKPKNHAQLPPAMQWDEPPEIFSTAFAVYPLAALRDGLQGKVKVGFFVDPLGYVVRVEVVESPGPELAQAARAMLDTWRFKPATKARKPCYALLAIELEFTKDGQGYVPVSAKAREIIKELKRTPSRIVPANELDAVPEPMSRRPPQFPSSLLSTGEGGQAMIEFFIDEEGYVELPHVLESTKPEFGYAAAQTIATWRFQIPRRKGKAVMTRLQVPVTFAPPAPSAVPVRAEKKP